MTRILFWNVEQFRDTRFYSNSVANDPDANLTQQQSSVDRHDLLYRVILAANPDVLVIVEVTATGNNASNLAGNNGGVTAALQLLAWLRGAAGGVVQSAEWRLVPPLWIAGAQNAGLETVAVFYRGVTGGVTRYFTGPNLWPGGVAAVSREPPLPGAAPIGNGPYGNNVPHVGVATNFAIMLQPAGAAARNVPVGALHNAGLPESNLAARYKMNPVVPVIPGPGVSRYVNFGAQRPPYMVTFTEDDGAGTLRDLTVFAIHGPANAVPAANYIAQLPTVREIASGLGAHETRVIGGDFNNNLLDGAGNANNSYNPLTALGYQLMLQPAGAAPMNLDSYLGYFATHLIPIANNANAPLPTSKFLWSNGMGAASLYPRYGYQSAQFYSLDNVLVWPFNNGYNYQTTILNTVVSSPLNGVAAPIPGNPPIGSLVIAAEMPNVPVAWAPWPPTPQAPDFTPADSATLLEWDRYGHIVSTSDHFALFVDVDLA